MRFIVRAHVSVLQVITRNTQHTKTFDLRHCGISDDKCEASRTLPIRVVFVDWPLFQSWSYLIGLLVPRRYKYLDLSNLEWRASEFDGSWYDMGVWHDLLHAPVHFKQTRLETLPRKVMEANGARPVCLANPGGGQCRMSSRRRHSADDHIVLLSNFLAFIFMNYRYYAFP